MMDQFRFLTMKGISVVVACLCVVLLPLIVIANDERDASKKLRFKVYLDELNDMANRGDIINGVFNLSENGHLGSGTFGFTYKGILEIRPSKKIMVAMKFTPANYFAHNAVKEYKMYTYLDAINNPNIEAYGIPSVYYYGRWNGLYMMAITLLDTECYKISGANGIDPVDVLIVFREFVRITKYIHSRGVCHSDIKLDNIMLRKHQAFIIDFGSAYLMYGTDNLLIPMEQRTKYGKGYAKQDWSSFLTVMCTFIGVKFDFAVFAPNTSVGLFNEYLLVSNIINTMETLEQLEHGGLRRVFVEFAKHAFEDAIKLVGDTKSTKYGVSATILCYDQLYKIINEEIAKYSHEETPIVSWLICQQRKEAVNNLKKHPIPDISSLNDPFGMVDFKYPKVNFDYFPNLISAAKASEASSSSQK